MLLLHLRNSDDIRCFQNTWHPRLPLYFTRGFLLFIKHLLTISVCGREDSCGGLCSVSVRSLDSLPEADVRPAHKREFHKNVTTIVTCVLSSLLWTVQRRGGCEGLLRHDAQRSAQAHALWCCLHSRHRSHSKGVQALASDPSKWFCLWVELQSEVARVGILLLLVE